MPNVAILGSTSHIAKNLLFRFEKYTNYKVFPFCRKTGFDDFPNNEYDLIINCVGTGLLKDVYVDWFMLTEKFDNLILDYLRNINQNALYISFSSGSVYGRLSYPPKTENAACPLIPNKLQIEDYHRIAKLNSEAKHRAFNWLNIVDFRIFSFFSRFVDLNDSYFMTQVINHIKNKKVLKTNSTNWIRDFANPDDLFNMIINCPKINTAIDVISYSPASKFGILNYFKEAYKLDYDIDDTMSIDSSTGNKDFYFSDYYNPLFTYSPNPLYKYYSWTSSIDTIMQESKYII